MAGIIVLIADRKTIIFGGRITGFFVVFGLPDSLLQQKIIMPIVSMCGPVVDMMAVSTITMKIPRIRRWGLMTKEFLKNIKKITPKFFLGIVTNSQ